MTTIQEEDERHPIPPAQLLDPIDFSQLLPDVSFGDGQVAWPANGECPLHPDLDRYDPGCVVPGDGEKSDPRLRSCLCHGFVGDWTTVTTTPPDNVGLLEPDYSRFENWLPQFLRPEKPCDYCRAKKLNCYVQRGEPFCTPCTTLFRECSLTNSQTLEATNYVNEGLGTFLDTLHSVDEDLIVEMGGLTGVKPLHSREAGSGTTTPNKDDAPGSSKRNGIRFPRSAVKILRDWLDAHADNPYPSEDEKATLERQTELKPTQIANWLANARRRRKVSARSRPKLCVSPSLGPTTPAIDIPRLPDKPWDELNPFERWKHSPPENEPADLSDIVNALAHQELPSADVATPFSSLGRSKRRKSSSIGSSRSQAHAPSSASQETGFTSSMSASSARFSNGTSPSTHGSFGSFSSGLAGKRSRRRRKRPSLQGVGREVTEGSNRIYSCTFCTDRFNSKYDWTRHEKSLHLSLEKWICTPMVPTLLDDGFGRTKCFYCELPNPSTQHLESHDYQQCASKSLDARTFYRKDHLRQHLRLIHGCEMIPSMERWKFLAVNINSRCGFCSQQFTVWQERVDHLAAHFKAGSRMSQWKGCRGLDPAAAATVQNAMPPYLIGIEAASPNPFSASNKSTWKQDAGQEGGDVCAEDSNSPKETGEISRIWELLAVGLSRYLKETASKEIIMSDEMLQAEAKKILYESEDSWNQTWADIAEWLDLFKKAQGLDSIPSEMGGQGAKVLEDLEAYGDLGLPIPFAAVKLHAYQQVQNAEQRVNGSTPHESGAATSDSEQTSEANMRAFFAGKGSSHENTDFDAPFDSGEAIEIAQCCLAERQVCDCSGCQERDSVTRSSQGIGNLDEPTAKKYIQRHRYQLPKDKANIFATTTGVWDDSGFVPQTMHPSLGSIHETSPTGAGTFLAGDDVGHNPSTPMRAEDDDNLDSLLPESHPILSEDAVDSLVAAALEQSSVMMHRDAEPDQMDSTASHAPGGVSAPNADDMMDYIVDDEFDGVFDMPLDDTFGPASGY